MRRTLAACGLALLVLAGCSGGDDNDAAPAPTTIAAGGPSTTLRTVDTNFTGQGSAEFCNLARTYNDRFTQIGANATPAQLRTVAREGQTAINQAVNAAPGEIKSDVQVIANAFGGLLTDLEAVNYDVTKVTPATFARLQAPEFATSSQRFQAYMRNVCRVGG
jgi:hypothetical protein